MSWYCPRCGERADHGGTCKRDGAVLAEVGSHDLIGRTVGEYTVLARIGGGGFGHVYRAIHPRSGLVVAIKLLEQPIDAADSQRALTEARATAAIRHRNVVGVYDFGLTSDRRPYIVMEHLQGATLTGRWKGPRPFAELWPAAAEVLRGLAAAHRLGIVHRDLKPENVFLVGAPGEGGADAAASASFQRGERVVIVDFGLAKLLGDPRVLKLTATGSSLGTPRYMSPEQIRGAPVDGRSDLYSLGVMIYEALAGAPPFDAGSTFELFDAHLSRKPPLGELPRSVPRHVVAALDRALAKAPGDRFASADEMRRALASAPRRPRRWHRIAGAAAVAAAIAVPIVVASHRGGPAPPGTAAPSTPRLVFNPSGVAPRDRVFLRETARSLDLGKYSRKDAIDTLCRSRETLARVRAGASRDPSGYRTIEELVRLFREYLGDFDPDVGCP